jgi:hypothetical protein
MKTEICIDGQRFFINGRPTYDGIDYRGKSIAGLLFNSRMVQAIVDDESPDTRHRWAYPDTGIWDPERNTDDFCSMLPVYRSYGLLAVTIGLQGGGSAYLPEVWNNCILSAFASDGTLKEGHRKRLLRVLKAADDCGMVVIVNLFYWKQIRLVPEDDKVFKAVEQAADFLLGTGYRNILIDVANESASWWTREIGRPEHIHRLIHAMKSVSRNGRRLLVGCSTGGDNLPTEEWLDAEDISFPHGNGNTPQQLRERLAKLRGMNAFRKRPRPVCINEDGVNLDNLDIAASEYASWGYYAQGAGSHDPGYDAIWPGGREKRFEDLSGFQTLPVNWGINTPQKKAFFEKTAEITGNVRK